MHIMERSVRVQTVNANLQQKHELLRNEYQAIKRKLDSKNDALLIFSRDLTECQGERNQLRVMADQLRSRCQALKKQLISAADSGTAGFSVSATVSSQLEIDDLKQKLADAEGDIKILRAKIVKHRLGVSEIEKSERKSLSPHERDELIEELEKSQLEYAQLEQDMKQLLDLKEELETERDSYKTKYNRLNTELNYIMRGDEKHVVDIDAMIMENRFLQQRVKHLEEENSTSLSSLNKYKHLMEKRKPASILKSTTNHVLGGLLISQKQIKQLLAAPGNSASNSSLQMVQELKTLASTLLETINDKNLALSHQRKSNKLLGSRITDLEHKLHQLELSGDSNSFREMFGGLCELRADCANLKLLVPTSSVEGSEAETVGDDDLGNSAAEQSEEQSADCLIPDDEFSHIEKNTTITNTGCESDAGESGQTDLQTAQSLPTSEESADVHNLDTNIQVNEMTLALTLDVAPISHHDSDDASVLNDCSNTQTLNNPDYPSTDSNGNLSTADPVPDIAE